MTLTQVDGVVAAAVLRLHSPKWVGEASFGGCVGCRQPYPCETVQLVETITNRQ